MLMFPCELYPPGLLLFTCAYITQKIMHECAAHQIQPLASPILLCVFRLTVRVPAEGFFLFFMLRNNTGSFPSPRPPWPQHPYCLYSQPLSHHCVSILGSIGALTFGFLYTYMMRAISFLFVAASLPSISIDT